MKYIVIQERGGGYKNVASCSDGDDAITCAVAVFRRNPAGCVQAWAQHSGRRAFNILCLTEVPADRRGVIDTNIATARAGWRGQLKKWKAAQKLSKRSSAMRMEMVKKYDFELLMRLRDQDEIFRKAFWQDPPDLAAAEARIQAVSLESEVAA